MLTGVSAASSRQVRVRIGRKLDQEAARELAGKLGKAALVIPDKE